MEDLPCSQKAAFTCWFLECTKMEDLPRSQKAAFTCWLQECTKMEDLPRSQKAAFTCWSLEQQGKSFHTALPSLYQRRDSESSSTQSSLLL